MKKLILEIVRLVHGAIQLLKIHLIKNSIVIEKVNIIILSEIVKKFDMNTNILNLDI